MPVLLPVLIFGVLFVVVLLVFGFWFAIGKSKQNNQIRAMLRTADPVTAERSVELLRPKRLSDSLSRLLEDVGLAERLEKLLEQAGSEWTSTKLVMMSMTGAVIGLVLALQVPAFQYKFAVVMGLAAVGGSIPILLVRRKRAKRLKKFEEQFPEALDFLSRSLRAGHAFTVGLEMLVGDSPEPLATIFKRILHDLHLGASLESSFRKLVDLVPLVDVRFFVSSVLLQQETGGNLSEILQKLSDVIRDRFRIKGQVKAAAAHGKVTGGILVVMPIVVASLLFVSSPAYILMLFTDHDGRMLVVGAVVAQLLGFFCIKKITDIQV